ncbi:MAG: YeiH family protein [Limnochordia bacterium]|jgi:uncharacterized integral membrane protein (TIGR00698 family)|nr:putative sulfate exporter family transporter [Bacillota bacterium]NLL08618.1 putative sulfate exporter family transporter [Bacillota bacterium]HBG10043.1 putative sulfate exporter family transporter [Bacillota bacterium]
MLETLKRRSPGLLLTLLLALVSIWLSSQIPGDILGTSILALILGMLCHPLLKKLPQASAGVDFASRTVLRLGIILMGISLSFSQVLMVGRYALLLMMCTLTTAFGGGYLLGRLFKVNWKLSSLLSASTAICGGTAVATLGPVIEAEDTHIAYAISATFLFDLLTVILFPWFGRLLGLPDMSYGLWVGTAVNDTSSVVAAGYGFSDAAGSFAVIVKLTRTLFIVPIVLVFSFIHARMKLRSAGGTESEAKVNIASIFPWFVLPFIAMVALKSTGLLPEPAVAGISSLSKLFMLMAMGAIGLKTSFQEVKGVGWKPMFLGVAIDSSVVVVALAMQAVLQRLF